MIVNNQQFLSSAIIVIIKRLIALNFLVQWTLAATLTTNRFHFLNKNPDFPVIAGKFLGSQADTSGADDVRVKQSDVMKLYMDWSVDPCDDFYKFSCGNWAKYNPIPEDQIEHSTVRIAGEKLKKSIKEMLESTESVTRTLAEEKAKIFYRSCMNGKYEQKKIIKSLLDLTNSLGGWPVLNSRWTNESFSWTRTAGQLRRLNIAAIINEHVHSLISRDNRIYILIGEIDFDIIKKQEYISENDSVFLFAYRKVIVDTMARFGANRKYANEIAQEILQFETELAKLSPLEDEETDKEYEEIESILAKLKIVTIAELIEEIPGIDWLEYFETILQQTVNTTSIEVVMHNEVYIRNLSNLLSRTDPRILANYLMLKLVFNFDETTVESKRWAYCVDEVSAAMETIVGAMYVQKYYDLENDAFMGEMAYELQIAFKEILNETTWLDAKTKRAAKQKLKAVTLQLGFPEYLLSPKFLETEYSELLIVSDDYFQNRVSYNHFKTMREHSQIGKLTDNMKWSVGVAVVNAFYELSKNSIIIPAGILQPPIFHKSFPRSMNYATLGYLIGHELTHAFDFEGRHFGVNGMFQNWWTNYSLVHFHEKVECLIAQYERYSSVSDDGEHHMLDGEATLSENIADNGGIRQAFYAYKDWLDRVTDPDVLDREIIQGLSLSNAQLFFVSFAQLWCNCQKPAGTLISLRNDEHTLDKFRVIGTLSNFEEFSKEFQCPRGSAMNPVEKCRVW